MGILDCWPFSIFYYSTHTLLRVFPPTLSGTKPKHTLTHTHHSHRVRRIVRAPLAGPPDRRRGGAAEAAGYELTDIEVASSPRAGLIITKHERALRFVLRSQILEQWARKMMAFGRRKFMTLGAAALAAPTMRASFARSSRSSCSSCIISSPRSPMPIRGFLRLRRAASRKDSNGRIRIDLFPSMQLGGAASQLFLRPGSERDGRYRDLAGHDARQNLPHRGLRATLHRQPQRITNARAVQQFSRRTCRR